MVVGLLLYAWLLVHRFRVAWLEDQLESRGLEQAIDERRAESDLEMAAAVNGLGYIVAGYVVTFGALGAYVVRLFVRGPGARPAGAAGGAPVDVTPRPARRAGGTAPKRNPLAAGVLVVVLVAVGFVVMSGLRSATLYYYNADEAVAQRAELGDDRFRLQGTVDDDVVEDGDEVTFDVAFNGATVPVRHEGDPPELFQPGIPVVLEGRWDGDVFVERPHPREALGGVQGARTRTGVVVGRADEPARSASRRRRSAFVASVLGVLTLAVGSRRPPARAPAGRPASTCGC